MFNVLSSLTPGRRLFYAKLLHTTAGGTGAALPEPEARDSVASCRMMGAVASEASDRDPSTAMFTLFLNRCFTLTV
jgi:hypothetical protein